VSKITDIQYFVILFSTSKIIFNNEYCALVLKLVDLTGFVCTLNFIFSCRHNTGDDRCYLDLARQRYLYCSSILICSSYHVVMVLGE